MQLSSLAYRTEIIFHNFDGKVLDRGDYVVVQSPLNPGYYLGNLLLFSRAPGPGDAARWRELFEKEVATVPGVRHLAYGWDSDEPGDRSELIEAGFELQSDVVLVARQTQPARALEGVTIRKLSGDDDWHRVVALNRASEELTRTSNAFALFRERSFARKRGMAEAGLGQWMGAFVGQELVAHMGIFRGGELARFADVETHPDYRRRGICGALTVETTRVALDQLGASAAVIIANPNTVAERVYRAAGFSQDSRTYAAYRSPRAD